MTVAVEHQASTKMITGRELRLLAENHLVANVGEQEGIFT
jgi:hypothetical protein